jgi:hypothetical protein
MAHLHQQHAVQEATIQTLAIQLQMLAYHVLQVIIVLPMAPPHPPHAMQELTIQLLAIQVLQLA